MCESDILMSSLAAPTFVTGGALASRDGRAAADALAALVERAREGDGRAFDRLMIETQERVVGLAWRMLGSREDARDAAQEVYLRVFRHLGSFRSEHDFHGWLYRITINVCRDAARRRRRAPVSDAAVAERGGPPEAEEALLGAERWSRLLEALASLTPKERAALVLRDLEGLTSEQVARVLGSRPGTVRGQIASARMKVRSLCVDLLDNGKGGLP
jgi:RNA polymerase sigma-70 factor (ECF subfamily)